MDDWEASVRSLAQWKPLATAAALGVLWVLEGMAPMFMGRSHRLGHAARNVGLGILNAALTAVVFVAAIAAVTAWSAQAGFGLLHRIAAPAWVEWCMAVILFDLWQYVWHRLNHRVPILWRFHSVHHTDAELDASSAVRFHTGEIVLSSIARLAVLPLLGMTLAQLLLYELILLPVILFHHSNVRVPGAVDRVLRTVIVTPWMHWVHHSDWQPETDSNYSSIFSWWDRLARSFRLRERPQEIHLGLEDVDAPQWRTVSGMLLWPFRRWGRHPEEVERRPGDGGETVDDTR